MRDRPQARVDIRTVDLGSELLIYDERTKLVHVLNPTARRIWQCCDGAHRVEEIVMDIARLFPQVPVERIRSDVHGVLEELDERRVLVWTGEEARPDPRPTGGAS